MIGVDETTPLLGAHVPGPSTSDSSSLSASRKTVVERIHFLDNLRAILTVHLIFHHAGILASLDSIAAPFYYGDSLIPLSLFNTINKSFLYETFFFVSGYSIHLGLSSKSDSAFLISRTVKTGLPALLWLEFARKLLVKLLVLIFGDKFFGRVGMFGSTERLGQLEGPGSYVFTLLIFDYIYLFTRFIGRRWPAASFTRLDSRIRDSRAWVLALLSLSFILVTGVTVGNCFGLRLIPFIYKRNFPFEFPGFGSPVAYIVAYVAGVNFPLVQRYVLISQPRVAVNLLIASAAAAYVSLGGAQDRWAPLWQFIVPSYYSEGARYFVDAGWNGHTVFFSLWSPAVFYLITISLVSAFASVPTLQKNWGVWVEHTYLQTYIHMVPVAIAAHFLVQYSATNNPILEAVLSAIAGIAGSWAVALGFIFLRSKLGKYIPKADVEGRIRRRDVEAAEE